MELAQHFKRGNNQDLFFRLTYLFLQPLKTDKPRLKVQKWLFMSDM
jgi:hypothetical protein